MLQQNYYTEYSIKIYNKQGPASYTVTGIIDKYILKLSPQV